MGVYVGNRHIIHKNRLHGIGMSGGKTWDQIATFEDGLLTPNPTGFSSIVGTNLSVVNAAAYNGSFGFSVGISDINARYGILNASNVKRIEIQFYFNPNSIIMAGGDVFNIFASSSIGPAGSSFLLSLQYNAATGYKILPYLKNDVGSNRFGNSVDITDMWHLIRCIFTVSDGSNNGGILMWIDGVSYPTNLFAEDNDTHTIGNKLFGAIAGIDAGTTGTIYIDDIKWREF